MAATPCRTLTATPIPTDQRGAGFPRIAGGDLAPGVVCDIGAFELSATCRGQTATLLGINVGETIVGTNGADVIHALGGNDFVRGRGGDDVICGGDGNDLIAGNEDNDTIDGEGGRDRALYGGSTPVNANLAAGTAIGQGNDDLIAIEDLSGSSGADTLRGNAGPNRLWGFGGEDTLIGLGGNDILTGGPGPDALNGGPGNDFCNGSVGLGDTAVNCETTQFVP